MSEVEGLLSTEHGLLVEVHGDVVATVSKLDDVAAIGALSSLTSVVGVRVATSPLEVDKVANVDQEVVGDKVILDGGVGLDDVT